jgi:hypothetical protein
MKPKRPIRWAGVEFQPDLQNPRKPVRLGVVLLSSLGDVIIAGRQPVLNQLPPEFEDASEMTVELAAKWVDNMLKDVMEADETEEQLARLNARWRWNLYLMRPTAIPRAYTAETDLLPLAKALYEKFVGERFVALPDRTPRHRVERRRRPRSLPPTSWLIAENMRRRFPSQLAATA